MEDRKDRNNVPVIARIVEEVTECDRPSSDDIACIFQEYQDPLEAAYQDEQTAHGGSYRRKCSGKFLISKLQKLAVRKGMRRIIQFWSDGLTPPWKLAFVFIKIIIYLCLLIFTLGNCANCTTLERPVMPFDCFSCIPVVVGKVVAVAHAFLFICRHRRDTRLCCEKFCYAIRARLSRQISIYPVEDEGIKIGQDEAEDYIKDMEQKLQIQKGKFTLCKVVVGNLSEVLLTIVNDAIGTMVYISSLYSFFGKQHFALFYGDLHWSGFFALGRLVFSSILLLFATHFLRIFTIGKNIYRLDKKIEGNVRDFDLPLPCTFSKVMFTFQWRLVAHVALSSIFQLYAILSLSRKIFQESCSPISSTLSSTSGIDTMLPFICKTPEVVNGYTMYNIIYIAFAPTVLGYLAYFVCNVPSFIEYMELIAISSNRQMEKLAMAEEGKDTQGGYSPITELVKVFCNDLDCDMSYNDLKQIGKRARDMGRQLAAEFKKDAPMGGSCYFITTVCHLFHSAFFPPAWLVGILHLSLFYIHISFMTYTSNTSATAAILTLFRLSDVGSELSTDLVPLAILFLLTSFPGPWIAIICISLLSVVIKGIDVIVSTALTRITNTISAFLTSIADKLFNLIVAVFFVCMLYCMICKRR